MPLLCMGASLSPQAVQQLWLHGHQSLLEAAVRLLASNVIIALLAHCMHGPQYARYNPNVLSCRIAVCIAGEVCLLDVE